MTSLTYVIAFVSDMARSVEFYRDVIGLPLKFESSEWSEFETGGTSFALHPAGSADLDLTTPRHLPAGSMQIGVAVDDLDAFHQRMNELNVACMQPPKDEDFGARLARYTDPDGLQINVSARATSS